MSDFKDLSDGILDGAQATQLALLVDLEACWENLRNTGSQSSEAHPSLHGLHSKQRAYDAFRAKLVAYNKQFAPAHVPELLLNSPVRLGLWCGAMRDLFIRVEHDAQGRCPAYLIEKAYRRADRLADRMGRCRVNRSNPPTTVREAIQELEALRQWCGDLAKIAPAA
jgi:hypothetical protein